MSLTSMLKSDTKKGKEFKSIIDIIQINIDEISKNIKEKKIKAPYLLGGNWKLAGQVGTAFDYLARFVIKHCQYKISGTAHNEQYVAKLGLRILLMSTENENNNYESTYCTAIDIIDEYIKGNDSPELFKRVVGISVYFAKLESIFRNGYSIEKEQSLKRRIDKNVERELYNQIEIFKEAFEYKFGIKTKKSITYYNPSFGRCSKAVDGADADIVINNTLIDFKSSKYLNSIEDDFRQLIGYYLFTLITKRPTYINKICLYFSRYGEFIEYEFTEKDKENILAANKKMSKFIKPLL